MTKNILHNLKLGTQLSLVTLLLASCFVIETSLFNGIITAKSIWVQAIAIVAIGYVVIHLLFLKRPKVIAIDILVSLLFLGMMARDGFNNLAHANPQAYLIQIALYYCLYIFFRLMGNNEQKIKGIITIYLLIVTVQALIGLLQLYGILNSHHALFKVTGTFHNPGPFSGFIVSGLPMALGLYLGTQKSKQSEVNNNQYSIISKQFWIDLKLCKVLSSEFWVRVNRDRKLNYFAQFVIVVLLLVLPATRSRAAWLGGIVGCLYILFSIVDFKRFKILGSKLIILGFEFVGMRAKANNSNNTEHPLSQAVIKTEYRIPITDYSIINPILKRIALCLLVVLILITSGYGLYKFKQGSADGRLLMWQVSWEMIKDKPITGWGQGGFQANYANYQAEWFRSGKGTEVQEMVAGSPDAPFNELIRVVINYGVVGVVGVFALLIGLFRKGSQRSTEIHKDSLRNSVLSLRFSAILKGGLISILIFSLFSYPIDVTPILVQLLLVVALIANKSTDYRILNTEHQLLHTEIITTVLLITITPIAILNLKKQYSGLAHWQEANELYKYELYSDASGEFDLAKEYLPKEGLLLQMQAKCYTMFEKWDEAIHTAKKARNYINGQILYIVLGDINKALEKYKESELAYKQASFIVPHKFFPKYLLAMMYHKSGQTDKTVSLVNELLNKEIKVESTAIQEMRDELTKIINTKEKEQEATLLQNVALPVRSPFLKKERRCGDKDTMNTN